MITMPTTRKQLQTYLEEFLNCSEFQDYGPNGLQVQGGERLGKLAFAVSATRDSAEKAAEGGADALIVHHGLFWKFHGARPLTDAFYHRVAPLIKHDINLFGYHLPLDAHPELGNAKALANRLGLTETRPFGEYRGMPTGVWGQLPTPLSPNELSSAIEKVCRHSVITSSPAGAFPISTMGIITGGANGDWTHSHRMGLDAYLTGEISEHDWHETKESGITMYAAGHHATEQFGIQDLMEHLRQKFSLECFYIDSPNPA